MTIVFPETRRQKHRYKKRADLATQYIRLKKRQTQHYSPQRQSRLASMAKELGYT